MDQPKPTSLGTHTVGVSTSLAGERTTRRFQIGVSMLAGCFLVLCLAWYAAINQPESLNFRFNVFGLLSSISFVTSIVAWITMQRIQERSESLMWFSLTLFCLAEWAGAEALIRFSGTAQTAIIWAPLTTLGSVFMPVSLYMFALTYTNTKQARQPIVLPLLVMVSAVFVMLDGFSSLMTVYDSALATLTPWGYIPRTGLGYIIISLWIIVLTTMAVLLLARFRRHTLEPTLRRQSMLFIIAISLPLVGGSLTDGLLPILNVTLLPPFTVALVTAMGVIICYGIYRYQFFSFTPELIAGQILDTMNEAVIGVGADLRLRYANAGAGRLLGYSTNELARLKLADLFTQRLTSDQLRKNLLAPLAQSSFYNLDSVDIRTAGGAPMTAKLSITAVGRGSGDATAYIIVLTDITAIAQATALIEKRVSEQTHTIRETKAQLDSSINSLELGFIITDDRPEVIMVNRPAHQLFCGDAGHAPSDCHRVTLATIDEQTSGAVKTALAKCFRLRRPQQLKLLEFNGRSWRAFITPVVDGATASGATIIFQDITEEQILNRSRDEFFSIASHELRTPLTAIKGGASLMLQYYADALKDPSLREIVGDIHESSDRLIAIVNDFLDASRLEQGRITYNYEELNLARIVEKVVYEMGATAATKGVSLRVGAGLAQTDHLPTIIADQNRLKQILFNLVGNAVKFTQKSGSVTVEAVAGQDHVNITVTDTGQGIPLAMQPLLFHKFQQAGESLLTRDAAGGTGLGLYISRLLAGGMGGKLTLEHSEPGKGSVFSFTLPVATPGRLKKLHASQVKVDTKSGLTVTAPDRS